MRKTTGWEAGAYAQILRQTLHVDAEGLLVPIHQSRSIEMTIRTIQRATRKGLLPVAVLSDLEASVLVDREVVAPGLQSERARHTNQATTGAIQTTS
jgi:hypothetical protein